MKTLILLAALNSSVVLAASYEVPTATALKDYAHFELKDFSKRSDGYFVSLKYTLPVELTGTKQSIELSGIAEAGKPFLLFGEQADAECLNYASTINCTIRYNDLEIDEEKALQAIRKTSKSEEEVSGRLQVMRFFSTDPVGIITY
jgi:hypothetical protein